jgi:cysteinyl-tRNA synthetase
VRNTVYELIQLGNDAAYEMLDIAKETQKARDFEVVGQLLKAVGDLSDKLLDNQQKIKKIEEELMEKTSAKVTNNTTNALFVGSTAELQKFLKDSMKEK